MGGDLPVRAPIPQNFDRVNLLGPGGLQVAPSGHAGVNVEAFRDFEAEAAQNELPGRLGTLFAPPKDLNQPVTFRKVSPAQRERSSRCENPTWLVLVLVMCS